MWRAHDEHLTEIYTSGVTVPIDGTISRKSLKPVFSRKAKYSRNEDILPEAQPHPPPLSRGRVAIGLTAKACKTNEYAPSLVAFVRGWSNTYKIVPGACFSSFSLTTRLPVVVNL